MTAHIVIIDSIDGVMATLMREVYAYIAFWRIVNDDDEMEGK